MHPLLRNAGKEFFHRLYSARGFLWRLPPTPAAVALTFDDGPDPEFTPAILDLLAREGAKASFFVIGRKVAEFPDLARRIVAEGHAIGSHTQNHLEIVALSPAELTAELTACDEAIRAATGVGCQLFRPPRGRMDFGSIRRVCRAGYCLVHWTQTYSDYQRDGLEPLLARFRRDPPRPRDIVLLHDHNEHTVNALARLLPEWRAAGLRFVALNPAAIS